MKYIACKKEKKKKMSVVCACNKFRQILQKKLFVTKHASKYGHTVYVILHINDISLASISRLIKIFENVPGKFFHCLNFHFSKTNN